MEQRAADFSEQDFKPAGDAADLILPHGFSLNDRGLWYRPPPRKDSDTEQPEPVRVCGPFCILARTSDDSHHGHGLLLKWIDHDGEQHTWPMPRRLVHADGNAIAAELEDAGLPCGTSRLAHEYLKHFLGAVKVQRHVRCVDQAGWHGASYVMPNGRVFGADTESVVLQTERAASSNRYAERGGLDAWRNKVARYAVDNDLLVFAISMAFAPPLLDVLSEPSGGVHLHGISQTGKTTLLRSAMSVYGPADDKHMRTWRATANGLEAVASETSDGLLVLDELSQANAREVDQIIYMLGNNAGKARANRAGGARPQRNWRTMFLSTGEITLESKLSEAGLRVRAGQDVRMIGLLADAGVELGVFQKLHGFPSGAALAEHLRASASTDYGTAGPAYLDQLARERANDPETLVTTLRALCDKFLRDHVPVGADGQVRSVAKRFALIGGAGALATAYSITGWPEDAALHAAGRCFKRSLATRGGIGAAEAMQAVKQVRELIAAHGSSRFERIGKDAPPDQKILNRAGWRELVHGEGWQYLITPECWKVEVCRGLSPKLVADALIKEGFLLPGKDRSTQLRRTEPCSNAVRVYVVGGSILGGDDDGE